MKILIIDDEIPVASLLADAVRQQGHEAVVANDGREGLALLDRHEPDAVFLDIWMPEMSGVTVLRAIRRTDPSLPVVVITGHAREKELEEVRRLGVVGIIEKPDILRHVGQALAGLDAG